PRQPPSRPHRIAARLDARSARRIARARHGRRRLARRLPHAPAIPSWHALGPRRERRDPHPRGPLHEALSGRPRPHPLAPRRPVSRRARHRPRRFPRLRSRARRRFHPRGCPPRSRRPRHSSRMGSRNRPHGSPDAHAAARRTRPPFRTRRPWPAARNSRTGLRTVMNAPRHIHLLGIAGSAMAPVAGMLRERGFRVTGSDVGVYPPASTLLDSLGIPWNEGYREENLNPAPDLAVIGNAISRGNPELEHILDRKIPYCSMPQILERFFIPGHTSIVIAGTHGKTTTTAMLAWIFHVAGRRPDFLIGGVAPNFGDRSYGL